MCKQIWGKVYLMKEMCENNNSERCYLQYYKQQQLSSKITNHFWALLRTMSSQSMSMTPAVIAKLSPNDAKRLSEYIAAIEKENKSRNEERVFMENYINDLKNELEQMQIADRGRKNKENQLNSEINRLTFQNRRLTADLSQKDNFIENLLRDFENLRRSTSSAGQKISKLEEQYKQKIAEIIQENKRLMSELEDRKNIEIDKLDKNNIETTKKLQKYQQMYNQNLVNFTKTTTLKERLQKQNMQLKQKIKQYEKQHNGKSKVDAAELIKAKQQIEKLQDKFGLVAMENERLQYQCQENRKQKVDVQNKLIETKQKYQNQKQEWTQKQINLQQFLSFVRSNVNDMENTIEDQNKQIALLKLTNQKLKGDILDGLQKMSMENERQKQLNKIKIELASCKGKLAQKQRQLSTSGSKIWTTPAQDYFPSKTRIKTQQIQDDKKSMRSGTFSTRQKIKRFGQNVRNSKTIGSQNIIIPN